MNHRIGGSAADVSVLLDRLAGSERPGRAQAFSKVVMAALIGVALPVFLLVLLSRERTYEWGWWLAFALALAAPLVALQLLAQGLAADVITPDGVSRVSPLGVGSWRINRTDIYAIDLELSAHGPIVHIVPTSGRRRSLLLLPGFHERLSRLYPEIGTPGARVELSPRLGRSMYVLLAVVVTAFIALIVILARQGLLTWE